MRSDPRETFESRWQLETPHQIIIEEDCLSGNHQLEITLSTSKNKRCSEEAQSHIEWHFNGAVSFVFWTCWQYFSGLANSKISTKKSVLKGARISKPPLSPPPPNITFIDEITFFMHKYIERVVNVERDNNCGYRAISTLLGKGEDNHTFALH